MNAKIEKSGIEFMAADTMGKDLLAFMLQEFKAMPDVWQKMPQYRQDTVIDRARERIQTAVEHAVNLIVSEGKTVVIGDLEAVNIKGDIKATFVIAKGNETNAKDALYAAVGQACSIIVSDVSAFTGGMHEIKGEADQRSMDIGSEYEEREVKQEKPRRSRNIAALPYSRLKQDRDDVEDVE